MTKLILLRHGQSQWNLENRFTGWWDVGLTDQGALEAQAAGKTMLAENIELDQVFTSVQSRAIKTANMALGMMRQAWVPMTKDWRLNERHYGALTGLNKAETAAEHGAAQVLLWRRSFDVPPPPMVAGSKFDLSGDRRYAGINIPAAESLKDTIDRVLPYFEAEIAPMLRAGKTVMIVAHGNSLRALVKHLSGISDAEILHEEIPTGRPMLYDLADNLAVVSRRYLD